LQHKPVIKPIGSSFVELSSTDSTNNYALARVRDGEAAHGTAFFAHQQTAGKGQMGRQWISEKDVNIALSIVLEPNPLLISQQFQLSACIAVAVHKCISRYAGHDTRVKWPNDLYWKDRKAGGILIENIIKSSRLAVSSWQWAIAGIGVNVNQVKFSADLPNPVSLKQITGKNFDTVQMAKELCGTINEYFVKLTGEGFTAIYKEYNNCLYKLNEPVTLKKNNAIFQATIKGVAPTGQLLTHNNSVEEQYEFGEVAWLL
jgi:BirA family biotin operon repressor/biotin-[acetyl-CoA-carboxylase] ligase